MSLVEPIIRREIARHGPIPFARFMALALYCPKVGYYERPDRGPGRRGDFYTSVSVGSLFGELLAFQFAQWLAELPDGPPQIVEAGAHDGQLAADVLAWLKRHRPDLSGRLGYCILEPSPARQSWQRARLEEFAGCVQWADSFETLPHPVTGVIFANELLDALPVRRLGWDAARGQWFEWGVGLADNQFTWVRLAGDAAALAGALAEAGVAPPPSLLAALPDEFTLDLCPEAAQWWAQAAQHLRRGRLLTADYGLTSEELLQPHRAQGTARAFCRHRLHDDLLARPGEQDLTAHVNFTQLQRVGEAAGLRTEGLFSQGEFLTGIARRACEPTAGFGEWTPERRRQLLTLTHPNHLGERFRVLSQVKEAA